MNSQAELELDAAAREGEIHRLRDYIEKAADAGGHRVRRIHVDPKDFALLLNCLDHLVEELEPEGILNHGRQDHPGRRPDRTGRRGGRDH